MSRCTTVLWGSTRRRNRQFGSPRDIRLARWADLNATLRRIQLELQASRVRFAATCERFAVAFNGGGGFKR